MNIILVPGSFSKGHNISLTPRQLLTLALFLFIIIPAVIGTLAYRIQALLNTDTVATREPHYLKAQAQKLTQERQALELARRQAESHFQALAQRLGHLQAQVLRLNALGSRLVSLAGLDKREFNFQESPALGGPELKTQPSSPDLTGALENLSSHIHTKTERLTRLESLLLDRKLQAAVTPLGWPVEGGWMSSGFGVRTDPFTGRQAYHEGVDIANRLGAPIHAMGAGVVTHAGHKDGYGLLVEINHGRGHATRYAHAKGLLVKEGDKVDRGQAIALVGSSGRSTGPHLHFEVLKNDRAVNPVGYLKGG